MIIEIESIKHPVIIDEKVYLLVEKTQIETLLKDNINLKAQVEDYKQDIAKLKTVIQGILKVLGLLDESTGTIRETIANGEENYIKPIGKALTKLITNLTFNKEAVVKDFAFIELIFPILKKHA